MVGAISKDTVQPTVLATRFLSALKALDRGHYVVLRSLYPAAFARTGNMNTDELHDLLYSAIERLGELAPDGYYFGAHAVVDAQYGFWPVEA